MTERYDAILAHVYQLREVRKGTSRKLRPSIRSHIQISALLQLRKEDKVGTIFIAGGHVWGDDYPSFAEIMSDELIRRGVDKKAVMVRPIAQDTPAEVDAFLQEARNNSWGRIADLSNSSHQVVIKDIYRRRKQNIDLISAEQVLAESRPRYRSFFGRFRTSMLELRFKKREQMIRKLYGLGLEKALSTFAKLSRKRKFTPDFDY